VFVFVLLCGDVCFVLLEKVKLELIGKGISSLRFVCVSVGRREGEREREREREGCCVCMVVFVFLCLCLYCCVLGTCVCSLRKSEILELIGKGISSLRFVCVCVFVFVFLCLCCVLGRVFVLLEKVKLELIGKGILSLRFVFVSVCVCVVCGVCEWWVRVCTCVCVCAYVCVCVCESE